MVKKLLALLLCLFITVPVYGANFTDNLLLELPDTATRDWTSVLSGDFISIDTAIAERGVSANLYPDFSTAISRIGSTPTTLLISDTQAISGSSVAVPSNITLQFIRPGYISVDSGYTLTISGDVDAGITRIFTTSGDVLFGEGGYGRRVIYADWFGALADDIATDGTGTDNTTTIQAGIDSLPNGSTFRFGQGGMYDTTSTLIFPTQKHITVEGTTYPGKFSLGEDKYGTILAFYPSTAGDTFIECRGTSDADYSAISWRNIGLYEIAGNSGKALDVAYSVQRTFYENISINKFNQTALSLQNSNNAKLVNVYTRGNGTYGISMDSSSATTLHGCTSTGNNTANLNITNSGGILVSGGEWGLGGGQGIVIGDASIGINLLGLFYESDTSGNEAIHLVGGCDNIVIQGCDISLVGVTGDYFPISIDDAQHVSIINNNIGHNGIYTACIRAERLASDLYIANNRTNGITLSADSDIVGITIISEDTTDYTYARLRISGDVLCDIDTFRVLSTDNIVTISGDLIVDTETLKVDSTNDTTIISGDLQVGGDVLFYNSTTGRVGINLATPGTDLEVEGNIWSTSTISGDGISADTTLRCNGVTYTPVISVDTTLRLGMTSATKIAGGGGEVGTLPIVSADGTSVGYIKLWSPS